MIIRTKIKNRNFMGTKTYFTLYELKLIQNHVYQTEIKLKNHNFSGVKNIFYPLQNHAYHTLAEKHISTQAIGK